ncbi:hypothetical protein [Natronococcus jeotgali]|uniref:hypothetical protein n=1 Tax=Natronococcus jeotgali TaxID=413812 RepID=UPI001461704E|nr:hypothetical protein [Natronococcus jeotgali]
MPRLQRGLVLGGILLNAVAFVYGLYARSLLYATVFLFVAAYLVVVYRTNGGYVD